MLREVKDGRLAALQRFAGSKRSQTRRSHQFGMRAGKLAIVFANGGALLKCVASILFGVAAQQLQQSRFQLATTGDKVGRDGLAGLREQLHPVALTGQTGPDPGNLIEKESGGAHNSMASS